MEAVAIAVAPKIAESIINKVLDGLSIIESLSSEDEILVFKERLKRLQSVVKKDDIFSECDKEIYDILYNIKTEIDRGLDLINIFGVGKWHKKMIGKKRILGDLKKTNDDIKDRIFDLNTAKISRSDKNIQEMRLALYQRTVDEIRFDVNNIKEDEEHSLGYIVEDDIKLPDGDKDVICTTYLKRDVVVKKIGKFDEDTDRQITKEIAFMSALRKHKGILRHYGMIQTGDNSIYLVVENLCNNDMTIRSALDDKELNIGRKGIIMMKLIESVQMIHAARIILKYLNSRTILIDRFDYPKLMQIGKGKWKGSPTVKTIDTEDSNRWYAPEVLNVDVISTEKADIYSLGIILWEFVTNKVPFENIKPREYVKIKKNEEELKRLFKIDHALDGIINRCLSFDIEKRPNIEELKIEVGKFYL